MTGPAVAATPPVLLDLAVHPDILMVGDGSQTITASVQVFDPDGNLDPTSVKVRKLREGKQNTTKAIMVDDGTGDDEVAGDGRFTAHMNFGTSTSKLLRLKVKAKDVEGQAGKMNITIPVVERVTRFSNTEKVFIMGEVPCNNTDAVEVQCQSLKAIVAPSPGGDNPFQISVVLTIRKKIGVPLENRWIIFDVGGKGGGYGQQSGSIGGYAPKRQYGDDLIRWYNDLGYVTLDITWWCNLDRRVCSDEQQAWVEGFGEDRGEGWYRDTNGTGYLGSSQRATAIYEWAFTQSGQKKVGAHAHSSGSGRLITMLTVDGGDRFVHTAVFDGGPVFAYIPWYCEMDDGPLGPQALESYVLSDFVPSAGRKRLFDIAMDEDNGAGDYHFCVDGVFEEKGMLASSAILMATTRELSDTHLAVILGGKDNSPAPSTARLWFQGYDATTLGGPAIPPLAAKSLTIVQGFCAADSGGTYRQQGGFTFPCSTWDPSLFPTADAVIFDETLREVTHSTSAMLEGATAMFEAMLATMPAADE